MTKEKGIVGLSHSTDPQGNEKWTLSPIMEYSYKEAKRLPYRYYNIDGRIVLIWEEADRDKADRDILLDSTQRQQRVACLDKLIGDKVTPVGVIPGKGKTGGVYTYVFKKDGSIQRSSPLY